MVQRSFIGGDMRVGDLVRARDGDIGIIIDHTHRFIKCLWAHGAIKTIGKHDIEVIKYHACNLQEKVL